LTTAAPHQAKISNPSKAGEFDFTTTLQYSKCAVLNKKTENIKKKNMVHSQEKNIFDRNCL